MNGVLGMFSGPNAFLGGGNGCLSLGFVSSKIDIEPFWCRDWRVKKRLVPPAFDYEKPFMMASFVEDLNPPRK